MTFLARRSAAAAERRMKTSSAIVSLTPGLCTLTATPTGVSGGREDSRARAAGPAVAGLAGGAPLVTASGPMPDGASSALACSPFAVLLRSTASVALYTCPRLAAATGLAEIDEKTCEAGAPSSSSISALARASSKGGMRSWSSSSSAIKSGGSRSGLAARAWPTLMNAGPRRVRSSRMERAASVEEEPRVREAVEERCSKQKQNGGAVFRFSKRERDSSSLSLSRVPITSPRLSTATGLVSQYAALASAV